MQTEISDAAPSSATETHPTHMGGADAVAAITPDALRPATEPTPVHATGIAGFLHRHRRFTKEPLSYTLYQFTRSAIAAVPYGVAMAVGHHLFGLLSVKGQQWGLTKEGIAVVEKSAPAAGIKAVDALANAELRAGRTASALYREGGQALVGRGMMRLANSPLNLAVQIAMGFTLFRFTGGVIKNLRDRVMNEKNTEADTANEVKHAGKTIVQTMKINWPAESTATPIAALALGFMNATVDHTEKYMRQSGENFTQAVKRVWARPSKLIQNGAIWTISYSIFFLLAESLFKDKQISLGLWKGHPNSLKNGPDDIVGGPAAAVFRGAGAGIGQNPMADHAGAVQGNSFSGTAEQGYAQAKDDDHAKESTQKLRFPFFTGEPSLGRFVIRRVLPVSVGITAYAALKRAGYVAVGGQMQALTVSGNEAMHGVGDHAKLLLKNAWKEGAATSMFGALWMATDAWGTYYDKFFHHLQREENKVELTPHQQANHADLLGKLNEKYQTHGRAA